MLITSPGSSANDGGASKTPARRCSIWLTRCAAAAAVVAASVVTRRSLISSERRRPVAASVARSTPSATRLRGGLAMNCRYVTLSSAPNQGGVLSAQLGTAPTRGAALLVVGLLASQAACSPGPPPKV